MSSGLVVTGASSGESKLNNHGLNVTSEYDMLHM